MFNFIIRVTKTINKWPMFYIDMLIQYSMHNEL